MARMKAVSLFLVVVLVLTVVVAALVAVGSQSGLVITITRESSFTLSVGTSVPAEPSTIISCDGCSGGGSGGV